MTIRERFINNALGKPVDRGTVAWDYPWPETTERWKSEGMGDNFDFGYDFYEGLTLSSYGVNYGLQPWFEEKLLEDLGNKKRVIDIYGIEKIVLKDDVRLQQFIRYPVESRSDWEKIIPRLDADAPGRYAEGWAEKAIQLSSAETAPVKLGGGYVSGFFGFLRQLMGDNCYYFLSDDVDLIKEILKYQEKRLCKIIRNVTASVRVDRLLIWEDMCYKTGPLVGPVMFRELFVEHYEAVCRTARDCGIPVIEVDSDGLIDLLLPLWLEAGVNMIQPFEVQSGMDAARVRKEFGLNFAIHGGVDKRKIALDKTEIDKEIERIRPVYEMGRFIPCMDHSIPPDVSFYNYQYYLDKIKRMVGA